MVILWTRVTYTRFREFRSEAVTTHSNDDGLSQMGFEPSARQQKRDEKANLTLGKQTCTDAKGAFEVSYNPHYQLIEHPLYLKTTLNSPAQ